MSLYPDQVTTVIVPDHAEPIHTQRLHLRPITMTDAAAIFEFRRRQEVADWLRQKTPHQHISESEALITKKIFTTPDASGTVGRQFFFAIICLNDPLKRVIGAAGVNSLVPAPSIGYTLHPDFWGKGYATEAVIAIVNRWCKLPRSNPEGLELEKTEERLFAACNKNNVGSVKVLQRSGFVMYDELVLEEEVAALFELNITPS
ncbi:uncharacterized protein N7511_005724 [Penicillium nucicola]|uniref:uncharacterized protein n=1 Tax=Penicillium nucicola TaxID=1850975 RepID=UPI002545421B|nr:uncharacterized protein N7511_005724 [Penicillium nucicola]KAJ5762342.1 hypothetical protein N7511_005724 [Penicillium nucicola]